MAQLKSYDLAGSEKGDVSIDDALLAKPVHPQLMKDYIIALRANKRQWSASTQTRAEVSHSKKKPHAQKGTGNARQGFLGAPQYRGGGRVHGPRPKFDQRVRINKKERRGAIRSQLSEVIRSNCIRVLDDQPLEKPSTKTLARFLTMVQLDGKRILFLLDPASPGAAALAKSVRNIPKVQCNHIPNLNGYDLARIQEIVIVKGAVEELKKTLSLEKS